MLDRIIKIPGPDHPITVEATGHRVIGFRQVSRQQVPPALSSAQAA